MLAEDEDSYIKEKRKQYFITEIADYNQSNLAAIQTCIWFD